jgi:hypothetical protein
MGRRIGRWSTRVATVAAAIAVAVAVWSGRTASAQSAVSNGAEASPPLFIELTSPDRCGTSHELGRRVALRSERIRFSAAAPGAIVARADIRQAGRGSVGATLTLVEPNGKRWSRQVHSASCDEVLDALALVLAVVFDPTVTISVRPTEVAPSQPHARTQPAPEPARRPPKPSALDTQEHVERGERMERIDHAEHAEHVERPLAAPSPPPDGEPSPAPEAAPPREPPSSPPPRPTLVTAAPARTPGARLGGLAGLGGLASWGPAPRAMPGVGAFAMLIWNRPSVWSPALQLTVARSRTAGFAAPGGSADFTLDGIALDLCPLWLRQPRVGVHLCAMGAAGRLSARGSQTVMPQEHVRPFATWGGSATMTVELGLGIHVTASGGAGAALIRDSFQFRPEVFHRVSAVVLTLGAGVGVRFL